MPRRERNTRRQNQLQVLVVVLLLGLPARAVGELDAATLPTARLQQMAQRAVERQQLAEAVPALAELDRRYRESRDNAVVQAREGILYLLGVGQLQAGDFPAAAETLRTLLEAYPHTTHGALASLFEGDAWYYQGRFAEARGLYQRLVTDDRLLGRLDAAQQLGLWDRLSDCHAAERDWSGGEAPFRRLAAAAQQSFDPVLGAEKRAKAASYLVQSAIAREDWEAAKAALSALSGRRDAVRHDLALNLALVVAGDALYQNARYGEALRFYQLTLSPTELREFGQAEVERWQAEQSRIDQLGGRGAGGGEARHRLAEARQRRDQVENHFGHPQADYTAALRYRVARCYWAGGRTFEAYWSFVGLADEFGEEPGQEYAEEAIYAQVMCAAANGQRDRMATAAQRYLARRDWRRFTGDVAHEWIQFLITTEAKDALYAVLRDLAGRIQADAESPDVARLVYVLGTSAISLGRPEFWREDFAPLLPVAEGRRWRDGVLYWLGLSGILAGDFDVARARFQLVRDEYARGPYGEDAAFRVGVCFFGLGNFGEARAVLTRFLEQHPHTRLRSEAEALLGDLAAADGRVDDALRAYAAAQEAGAELDPPHVGYINHAVFQAGRLLAANQRWAEMAAWFGEYIDRWGANGQLSEALYEQGRALRALGRSDELLESWRRALWRFGNDPHDLGADLILREYPATYHRERGEWPVAELADALAEAREGQQGTLALRLAYALWTVNPTEDVRPMVFEDELPLASVAVLAQVAEAEQERNPDLARAAAQAAIERAPQHAFAEPAWHVLGALEAAAGEVEAALEAFRQAAQRFPNSARTARARLREGDLLRAAGRTEEAIAAYRTVLQTRQWRGVAWAEANYKIGLAHFEAGEWKEAFGFYQRVYVLYGSVVEWAAPAYLQSGLALERMGRAEEAVATYRELLARDELNQTVAAYEARRRLNGAR